MGASPVGEVKIFSLFSTSVLNILTIKYGAFFKKKIRASEHQRNNSLLQLVKLFDGNKTSPTLLLHHSVIQLQQNKCPQGVAVLSWSRSKHSVHLMPEVG